MKVKRVFPSFATIDLAELRLLFPVTDSGVYKIVFVFKDGQRHYEPFDSEILRDEELKKLANDIPEDLPNSSTVLENTGV